MNNANCCSTNCPGGNNLGCSSILNPPNTFGAAFNSTHGKDGAAVFVMDWQSLSEHGQCNYLRFFASCLARRRAPLLKTRFLDPSEPTHSPAPGEAPSLSSIAVPPTRVARCSICSSSSTSVSAGTGVRPRIAGLSCTEPRAAQAYFEIGRLGICPQVGTL